MNFGHREPPEEPEINFIPLIDLLLVILIFLMVTTTYNQINGIQVRLPKADSPTQTTEPQNIHLAISAQNWQMSGQVYQNLDTLLQALNKNEDKDTWVIIHADANIPYQKLIDTIRTAQQAGLSNITMRTATSP